MAVLACAAASGDAVPAVAAEATVQASSPRGAEACQIEYTEDEVPALAAEVLWDAQTRDASWGEALARYNARKAALSADLSAGNNTVDLAGALDLLVAEPGVEVTGSDVFSSIFDEHSSLTPERQGNIPYGALAFLYNVSSWKAQVVAAGCAETRPAPPKEPAAVAVPPGSAVAPRQWQGAIFAIALLAGVVGARNAFMGLLPQLEQWRAQVEQAVRSLR